MSALKPIAGILVVIVISAGLAWAGGQSGEQFNGAPLFWFCAATGFVMHWLAFIPAYIWQTEHYFDLIGSLSYLATIAVAVAASDHLDLRSTLLAMFVCLWAARLGYFLFRRVRKAGSDRRFEKLKPYFWRFLFTWTLGGAWVFITLSAAVAAITAGSVVAIDGLAMTGIALWCAGFAFEVIADYQKTQFRTDSNNSNKFITTGLWKYSRHPNYFGEIVLWIGVALIALPVLDGWQLMTLISPVFVIFLLTRVSGIPMLEKDAQARWGDDAEYQQYVKQTPVLIPRPIKLSS